MYLSENLQLFDFFGHKVDFLINRKRKFKTTFGGFFSVSHIALCLFVFFTLATNMINRTNPAVVSMTIFQAEPGPSYMSKDSYFMMFGMQDPTWSFFIDETVYKTRVAQESRSTTGGMVSMEIPLERCTPEHIPIAVRDSLMGAVGNISNLYCIGKNYDNTFYLTKVYGQEGYKQITISVEICQNTTESSNCKSKEEINKMLVGGFFSIQSADYIINPNDYDNPAQMFYRHYFVPTSPKLNKKYYRYLKTGFLESDKGWIFDQVEHTSYTMFDSDRDFFDVYDSPDFTQDATPRQIMYVEMEKSNYETYYIRSYEKIQTVLAQLGGFINVLYITFLVITYPVKTKAFYDHICNKLFNFEESETVTTTTNNQAKGEKNDKVGKRITPHKVHVKKKEDYDFCPKDQPVYVSYWDDFWSTCKKRAQLKTKIKQRDAAVLNFLEKMDLVYVLKKFLEIEKLKILLLNPDQYHLFDFFPKPFVTKNGHILLDYANKRKKKNTSTVEELAESQIISNIDKINKAVSIKKAFENILAKEKPDTIDEKLLKLVESDINAMTKEKAHMFVSVTTIKE